jgi:Domain of unknown function (DU1801)
VLVKSTGKQSESPALWVCPKCGARLITRNLWHSCGQFALEDLFAKSPAAVLDLARKYVDMLYSLGDVQVLPQKTRLVCVARVRFAGLSPRKNGFRASFALRRWLKSPRIVKTTDYGPNWRAHFVDIQSAGDLDDELRSWLKESHDVVGLQSDIRPGVKPRLRGDLADAESQLQAFIDKFDAKDQRLIKAVRATMRRRLPTANELVWDNYNFFVIGYSPTERPTDSILSIAARANGLGICFIHGASLPDPKGLLLGSGRQTRFIRVDSASQLLQPDVEKLIQAAVSRANKPLPSSGRGKLIIRSISAKQRPRQRVAKEASASSRKRLAAHRGKNQPPQPKSRAKRKTESGRRS